MFKYRAVVACLLVIMCMSGLSMRVQAQSESVDSITLGETVGGFFGADDTASWQVTVPAQTILEVTMRRVGGVYTPRMIIETAQGNRIPARLIESAGTVTLVVEEGMPISEDGYFVRLFADDDLSDGTNVVAEYSLTLASRGMARADNDAGLPDVFAEPLVPLLEIAPEDPTQTPASPFSGNAITLPNLPDIAIYGAVDVLSVDEANANRFVIGNEMRTLAINNTVMLSTMIEAIAFAEDGRVWVQMLSGAVFSTEENITALSIDDIVRNLLVIVLEDGREIRSDFAELRQMSTQGNLLEIYVQSTQRIVVDSTSIRLTTGTTGISGLVVDGTTITLDKVGWDVLAVLDSIAWARIDDSTHIRSEILNLDLRQREDGRYGLSLAIFDREIDLRLDPLGIARLDITPQTLQPAPTHLRVPPAQHALLY
ncbi:MAG: hypothetical protein AAFV98_20215, partial [Chloroflexota bacterium]